MALLTASLAFSSSTIITITPATDIANGASIRNSWATNYSPGYTPQVLETFEGFASADYNNLSTGVGTFSIPNGTQPGGPWTYSDKTLNFRTLNSSNTPFSGRFNTTNGGKNWLDSNDITGLQLTTSLDSLFFFITDTGDCGGTLQIVTQDGTIATIAPNGPDGNLYFVGITSTGPIGSIRWTNDSNGDGFGLDDFGYVPEGHIEIETIPSIPEPGSWPIAAAALLAIPLIRKWKSRASVAPEPSE